MPIMGGILRFSASNDEVNPPIPRNAACPSEPCPEVANRFQLEAYVVKMAIRVKTRIDNESLTTRGIRRENAMSAMKM